MTIGEPFPSGFPVLGSHGDGTGLGPPPGGRRPFFPDSDADRGSFAEKPAGVAGRQRRISGGEDDLRFPISYLKTLCVSNKVSLSFPPRLRPLHSLTSFFPKRSIAAVLLEDCALAERRRHRAPWHRTPEEQKEVLRMSEDLRLLERLEKPRFYPGRLEENTRNAGKAINAWVCRGRRRPGTLSKISLTEAAKAF